MKVFGSLEALEARKLLSVTIDSDGWTNFTRAPGAHTIYVSSSAGSDKNDGLTSAHPVKTLGKARSLVRDGTGDWMLLKAGDVWFENLSGWSKSGLSSDYPLLISSYGKGERPVLETGTQDGFSDINANTPIKHVAITGILFFADTRDPDSPDYVGKQGGYGLHTLAAVDDLLVENCVFDYYVYNLSIQGTYGPATHIGLRRNLVLDAYTDSVKSEGLYMSHASSVMIQGNVFDHNGWNAEVAPANVFSHNIYLDESNNDVYVEDNIIADASSHGLQARCGGTIEGNVFINNPIGLLFGNGRDARDGGVEGVVSGNVFLGTGTINGAARGWAIEIGNTSADEQTLISGNIIAQDQMGSASSSAIVFSTGEGTEDDPLDRNGVHNVTLEGNIVYRWQSAITINSNLVPGGDGATGLSGLVIKNNDFQRLYSNNIITQGAEYNAADERFQGNRYFSSGSSLTWFRKDNKAVSYDQWYAKVDKTAARVKVKYNDPERDIQSYNATQGGKASVGAFLTQARLMAQRIWNPAYSAPALVAYMQAGFKVNKIPPTVTATNLTSKNTQPTRSQIFFLFDKDVSSKLTVDDLVVTNRSSGEKVATSAMQMSYDATTNQATWTFPGLSNQMLAAGDYDVELVARGVVDAKNTMLDGNFDGLAGGNFERLLKIRNLA